MDKLREKGIVMATFEELALMSGTDKFAHGYMPHYADHFRSLRSKAVHLLEIGVHQGASLRMWAAAFSHEGTQIEGVDVDPSCAELVFMDACIQVTIGDIKTVDTALATYDIIIDDGSHLGEDIVHAFNRFWDRLESGGWYVIEDNETHWRTEYLGDLEHGDVASEHIDALIHELLRGPAEISEAHIYEQIIFLRKS